MKEDRAGIAGCCFALAGLLVIVKVVFDVVRMWW